jgi:predicted kinase
MMETLDEACSDPFSLSPEDPNRPPKCFLSDTIKNSSKRRQSIIRKSLALKPFSVLVSTDQYNSTEHRVYFGPYSHLRKNLDYSYHTNYRKERQWLQDSIIEDMLDNVTDQELCIHPTDPWLIYTVGAQGAGKKYVVSELVKEGRLPLLSFVSVDPEEIRRRLPEFSTYAKKNPFLVEPLTEMEVGYISEILVLAALQSGRNVVVDGSLHSTSWHKQQIQKLRQEYPTLKFAILHVTAPLGAIIKRLQVSHFLSIPVYR